VLTLGTFAVPQVIGTPAGFTTITTRIYADLSYGSDPQSFVDATTLAVLLVIITLIVIGPADLLLGVRLQLRRTSTHDLDWPSGGPVSRTLKSLILANLSDRHCRPALAGARQRGDHPCGRLTVHASQLDMG
jgi:iron(III) transport system permease protein